MTALKHHMLCLTFSVRVSKGGKNLKVNRSFPEDGLLEQLPILLFLLRASNESLGAISAIYGPFLSYTQEAAF